MTRCNERYCSQHLISTTKEGFDKIKDKIPASIPLEIVKIYDEGVIFGWNHIDWDETYNPDIKKMTELLHRELFDELIPYEELSLRRYGPEEPYPIRFLHYSPVIWFEQDGPLIRKCQ